MRLVARCFKGDRSPHPCGRGGIGRRAGLRCQWVTPWRFESSRPHQCSLSMSCMALQVRARRAQWQVADFPEPGPRTPFRSRQQCRGIDGGGLRKRPRPSGRGKPRPQQGEVSLRNRLAVAAVMAAVAGLLLLLAGRLFRLLSALLAALTGLLLLLAGFLLRILALLAALIRHGVLLLSLSSSRTGDSGARFPPRFRQYRNQIAEGRAKQLN